MRIDADPTLLGDRAEMTAEEFRAYLDGQLHPVMAQMLQDSPPDTTTTAKTMMDDYLAHGGFGRVEREALAWPGRRFRADWFLPNQHPAVIVEYDGMMRGSAHASITGALRDSEKGNLAQALGYRFYRVNARSIHDGSAFTFLDSVLEVVT